MLVLVVEAFTKQLIVRRHFCSTLSKFIKTVAQRLATRPTIFRAVLRVARSSQRTHPGQERTEKGCADLVVPYFSYAPAELLQTFQGNREALFDLSVLRRSIDLFTQRETRMQK